MKPWSTGRAVYLPGSRLQGLLVSLTPRAVSEVGILERITDILASANIPIVQMKTSISAEGAEVFIVADLSRTKLALDELLGRLREVSYVQDVEAVGPIFNGLVVDEVHFPPLLLGDRVVFLRRDLYEAMIKGGYERIGRAYATFLYHVGRIMGARAYESHMRLCEGDKRRALRFSRALFKLVGFGVMEHAYLDEARGVAVIRVWSSFECELFKGSREPMSHFIRGLLAGWMSRFLEGDVEATETSCIAKGDEFCEFLIRRKLARR